MCPGSGRHCQQGRNLCAGTGRRYLYDTGRISQRQRYGIRSIREEYAALLAAHTAKLQAERAERIYSEPAEEAAGISMEERLAALEAAVLEMALEG